MLGAPDVELPKPTIRITDTAKNAFAGAEEEGPEQLRLEIGPNFEYDLLFDAPQFNDIEVTDNGVTLRMNIAAARKATVS